MKLNSWNEADVNLLCVLAFAAVIHHLNALPAGSIDNALGETLFRNRRQGGRSNRCFLEKVRCKLGTIAYPEICENPRDKCITAKRVSLRCEYVCEAIAPQNGTMGQNSTTDIPATIANVPDSPHDPSYCLSESNIRVKCLNGGNCSSTGNNRPFCQCAPGWRGIVCDEPCALGCQNNGTCVHKNGKQSCNCPWNYEPATNCSTLKPHDESRTIVQEEHFGFWYIYVIVFCVLLVGILTGYVVLRRLRGKSLLVTKVFHFFQPYEDDDGKLFDAFISFKSSNKDYSQSEDEKFVLRTLQPKLEKELQFKTCVHYRDFMPGETIANNIMWAVENSRRTILILSPLYIQSEWARLEYQKAQQEMLQLRHKIIPVILEDISETTIEDANLKHILASVTYIEFPQKEDEKQQNRFWEMLQLALPKKRYREFPLPTTSHSFCELSSQESWQSNATDVSGISDDSAIGM